MVKPANVPDGSGLEPGLEPTPFSSDGPAMSDADDDLLFFDDQDGQSERAAGPANRWKMMIIDDEPEVHSITRLVLADFAYKGRPAHFISAHSAAEARAILAREQDIAVILLDVVMETDDAGLKLVHHIREELKNKHVRIILRTGQPGQAPERAVILEYDINDYKAKTQLTAQQLFTTTVAALRSYKDIMALELNRQGLEKIIEASSSLFQARSMKLFAAGVLTQMSGLIGVGPDAILCVQRGPVLSGSEDGLYVLAGSGRFERLINEPAAEHIDPAVLSAILQALEERRNVYASDHCALYMRSPNDRENVVYLHSDRQLSDLDRQLIELFCGRISIGFDNLHHLEQMRRAQEGAAAMLADMAERWTGAVDDPTLRIGHMVERIARRLRDQGRFADVIDDHFLENVGLAALLHDVGNAEIDPAILGKPGPLDEEERRAMKAHTVRGSALLGRAARLAEGRTWLHLGAEIARGHHERWDGSGYPDALAGAAIPLSARIVAVADVYDAMTRERPWRAALDYGTAFAEIRDGAGVRYDPQVVAAFLDVVDAPAPA